MDKKKCNDTLYVTGFWKTDQIVKIGLFYFVTQLRTTHTPPIHSVIIRFDWLVSFPEWFCSIMWTHNWDNMTHGGHYMENMCHIFTPVVMRHLLGPISMFGPMAGTSWTHSYSKQSYVTKGQFNLPSAAHPLLPPTPPPRPLLPPTPLYVPHMILQWSWKSCSRSSSVT